MKLGAHKMDPKMRLIQKSILKNLSHLLGVGHKDDFPLSGSQHGEGNGTHYTGHHVHNSGDRQVFLA